MPGELAKLMQVEYTPEFKRNLRALAKKYRHIRSDVQPLIDQLQSGEIIGDQVPRTRHAIFKVRIRNRDITPRCSMPPLGHCVYAGSVKRNTSGAEMIDPCTIPG